MCFARDCWLSCLEHVSEQFLRQNYSPISEKVNLFPNNEVSPNETAKNALWVIKKRNNRTLGWKDSNLRCTVPKTAALPLGHTPSSGYSLSNLQFLKIGKLQSR